MTEQRAMTANNPIKIFLKCKGIIITGEPHNFSEELAKLRIKRSYASAAVTAQLTGFDADDSTTADRERI
jgi:hypothetical protein